MSLGMNLKEKTAITLAELITSTLILGIIMLGVASVDYALRQTHKGTSQNALIAMRTSAILLHITKNAELATGDRNNPGIVVQNPDPATTTNIWIRKENSSSPDPSSYATDIWVSYTYDTASHNLRSCTVPDNLTACTAAAETLGTIADLKAIVKTDDAVGAGHQNYHLEITITNRSDPVGGPDTFNNPEYKLSAHINPSVSSY